MTNLEIQIKDLREQLACPLFSTPENMDDVFDMFGTDRERAIAMQAACMALNLIAFKIDVITGEA